MFIARVIGRVWATRKNENYDRVPLLVVQPLNEDLKATGEPEIAIDCLGLGEGEICWVEGGKEASYALPTKYGPSDSSIVARIESLDVAVRPPLDRPVRLQGETGRPAGAAR